MEENKKNYLLVSRGRYVCSSHGAFCDSSDGYLKACPLCDADKDQDKWVPNTVDRALQLINGLQGRSKRNLAIVSGLVGGAGLLRVVGGNRFFEYTVKFPIWLDNFSLIVAFAFILSVAFYALSMRQVDIVTDDQFPRRSLEDWENQLASELRGPEKWHRWAGYSFTVGIIVILLILLILFSFNFNPCEFGKIEVGLLAQH